jgi:hypothetical protein
MSLKRNVLSSAASAALMIAVFWVQDAKAAIYDFTFTGADYSLTGQLTTDTLNNVLSVTGNIIGTTPLTAGTDGAITGLINDPGNNVPPMEGSYTAPSGHIWFYNDVLFPSGTGPFVDGSGILFSFGDGNIGNLYAEGDTYYLSVDLPYSLYVPGDALTGGITAAIPEPSTWAMMIFGFAGIGAIAYRRRNKTLLRAA